MRVVVRAARSRELAFAGSAAVGLLLTAAVAGSYRQALWVTGETWPLDSVVREQNRTEAVFRREYASPQTVPNYKFLSLHHRKPAIVVLGSTRMAGVRGALFGESDRFYNAAGLVGNLADLQAFLDRIPKTDSPKVVLLGVDLWWFGYTEPIETSSWNRDPEAGLLARAATISRVALRPWLIWSAPRSTPSPSIGLAARLSGEGFRSDGSIVKTLTPGQQTGAQPFADSMNPPAVERVKNASHEFAANNVLSQERLERLRLILRQFHERGIFVIGVAPPFSTAAVDLLAAGERHNKFWADFRRESARTFRHAGFPFLDASDPRQLGLDDRYLLNGFQAGEVFWVRALDRFTRDPRIAPLLPAFTASIGMLRQGKPDNLLQLSPALQSTLYR